MKPLLTTVTAYWQRPEMLRMWLRCLRGAAQPQVNHLIYFVREHLPSFWAEESKGINITALVQFDPPGLSIGHYHNLGASQTNTEWVMKLDVDAMPHVNYFKELVPVLKAAKPREWFNGGMFYLNRHYLSLLPAEGPLGSEVLQRIHATPHTYSASSYLLPAATNFIARRVTYMDLGGCDPRFRGYGWEDYQQIYMLERHQQGTDPLPGIITARNVTSRCRDEISRRKARELWEKNPLLCLVHHWHPHSENPEYRASMEGNRAVLLDHVLTSRKKG